MRRYKFPFRLLVSLLLLTLVGLTRASGQNFDRADLEKTVNTAIQRGYAATVKIWGIDSLTQRQNSSQFSGVVVTAEGHILTAAHAIIPGNKFKVRFPDGKEFIGVALGRMGLKEQQNMPDLGMIRILSKGTWPVAVMGWSYSLKTNEPCISIAYPDVLAQPFPTVRFGRISDPANRWGFVQSTCKMEPGDSGGPLFDYMGRVVAIHSRIDLSEEVNYEVPVDLFRKHWTALNTQKDYEFIPQTVDTYISDPEEKNIRSFNVLENIKTAFSEFEKGYKENSVVIKSTVNTKAEQVLGTLFLLKSKKTRSPYKGRSFVLSKSSMVGDNPEIFMGSGKLEATIVSRNKESDLVLLQLKTELKTGIKPELPADTASDRNKELGRFLISILPDRQNEISVLSSGNFDLPKKFSIGYFGASANFINEQIILTRINPGSPAEKAGLQLKDQITGVNGKPIKLPPEYGAELTKYDPEEIITVEGVRNGTAYSLPVSLTVMPPKGPHPAYRFAGGKSIRSDGFNGVFAHDAILKPTEVGGPVYDARGKFQGVNIARFSRTTSLAVSLAKVYEFVLAEN
ncbi:MAG: PDZ domain-containing protein [Pedobacter sp.]|nr:MAG: PDZ domain-containing protein [Pedobacter sp.]